MKQSAVSFTVIALLLATIVFAGPASQARTSSDSGSAARADAVPLPSVTDFQFIKTGTTPPTEADCEAVGRTCFTPQAIQSAYNIGPLYAQGLNGRGRTIAVVDSYGSDTMAHDLHVFDQAFGLAPMCGEEGITCTTGMPRFSELAINGSPATNPQPGSGTGLENKSAWALEVALDVETAHAIAPGANILLVHSNNAETLGVQGFPQMMKAEDYVVTNHLADVISQSFGSAEDAFSSSQSLENLRFAFKNAAANGVTVLASSGDGGTANGTKQPTAKGGNLIPFPTVSWPGSDPLVTGVGGTYLCTDPFATTNQPRTNYMKPGIGAKCGSNTYNTGWYDIGGTSLSSPQWAGLVAIAGQINGGSLGPINAALYKIGASATRYAADFFDIATNNTNQGDPSIPGYPATKGWDPVTGLGTPNAAHLVPDLVGALHGN